MELEERIKLMIRDVPDFPKKGIIFKDITPLLADPVLSRKITGALHQQWSHQPPDGVIGIESRGFIFGMLLAQLFNVPFYPVRKAGKLPYMTYKHAYELEYGSAEMEIHTDAVQKGMRILIHDDLLATGGTAVAAAELVRKSGGEVCGYSFLVELSFLNGRKQLNGSPIHSLVSY